MSNEPSFYPQWKEDDAGNPEELEALEEPKETFRHLATIQEIEDIQPIEGADNIECAWIKGWTTVVNKGEFKVGDLAVFYEIDSFLPIRPEYEFLRKSSFRSHPSMGEGFRIKTCKLRGQLSQGLALSRAVLFPYAGIAHDVGTDVTEILGVRKYEPPIHNGSGPGVIRGDCKGNFPHFIRKTDQERVQNIHKYLHRHHGEVYEATLKIDGTSLTAYHRNGESGVCSRNWDLKEDTEDRRSEYWAIVKKTGVLDFLADCELNWAIQGELMGPGIQKNREKFDEHHLFVFDIWDIEGQRYLTPSEREVALETLAYGGVHLETVPFIEYITLNEEWTLQKFLSYAERPSINHPIGEGIVFKSVKPGGESFKVVSNQFLLKEKD